MAALCLGLPQSAAAATTSELFADGNRLFRDDLYWAALLRYQQAADAGMDTPLLHYNTGVAHYKAQQHVRARESLLEASQYGPLQPISHYNLGLNVSRLAQRAITQLNRELAIADPIKVPATVRERERKFTNFDLRARVGVGIDDNVYRSPSTSYIDLSNPAQPLVTPNVQQGTFIPVSLFAKYQVNSLENEGFFGVYRLGGRYFQDSELSNAKRIPRTTRVQRFQNCATR
jgi:hypothetical protein